MNNNAKGLVFILGLVIFTVITVACGSEPTATPSPIPAPTPDPGPVLPSSRELKQAGKELFSAFFTAVEAQDGAALHGLMVADIRERCSPERLQQALAARYPRASPLSGQGSSQGNLRGSRYLSP